MRRSVTKSCSRVAERGNDLRIAAQLERSVLLDARDAGLPHVAGDDARKRAAQIERQAVRRLIAMQLERAHRLVSRLERLLELETDIERPVEEIGVVVVGARDRARALRPFMTSAATASGIAEDHLVTLLRHRPERRADEGVQALEVASCSTPGP